MIGEKVFNLFLSEEEHREIKDCAHLSMNSMQGYIKKAIEKENRIVMKRKEK